MPYATQQQIEDRYGQEALLLVADRDGDGVADTAVVDQALIDATAEIDTYLAARYDLPLPSTPEVLVRLCVDIVIYRLAADADVATEEKRQRYEDAVALLRRMASGEVSLGLPEPPESSNGTVSINAQPRRFGRDKGSVF